MNPESLGYPRWSVIRYRVIERRFDDGERQRTFTSDETTVANLEKAKMRFKEIPGTRLGKVAVQGAGCTDDIQMEYKAIICTKDPVGRVGNPYRTASEEIKRLMLLVIGQRERDTGYSAYDEAVDTDRPPLDLDDTDSFLAMGTFSPEILAEISGYMLDDGTPSGKSTLPFGIGATFSSSAEYLKALKQFNIGNSKRTRGPGKTKSPDES
jgi:hypothetical protein